MSAPERKCCLCDQPPNWRGCLILGETPDGIEVWFHRLCAADALARLEAA